jgi:hypothetical protein
MFWLFLGFCIIWGIIEHLAECADAWMNERRERKHYEKEMGLWNKQQQEPQQ